MRVFWRLDDKRLTRSPRSVAIGIFDGVHLGHQRIIRRAVTQAQRMGIRSLVLTFDPHPERILRPHARHPLLMSLAHRLRFFDRLGVDETLVLVFDRKMAAVSRETFLDKILLGRLGMRALTVGHDFRFGQGGQGDENFLRQRSRQTPFILATVGALKSGTRIISSTRIRRLIECGNLSEAARMLGRPVSVYGTVVRGRGRGRLLGYPTANLDPHHETLPPDGVYAAWSHLNGRLRKGVIHIGARPTFKERDKSVEAHFFDFQAELYGHEIEVCFGPKLRPIQRFASRPALIQAIKNDAKMALKFFRLKPLSKAQFRLYKERPTRYNSTHTTKRRRTS